MTALTSTGSVPDVGGDVDAWGGILNVEVEAQHADLEMLNTAGANTILGRNEGTSGDVERLTGTEVTAMLDAVAGDAGSGGTKGLVPAPAAGDAAEFKFLKASGAWANVFAARGLFNGSTGADVGTPLNLSCTRNSAGDYSFAFDSAVASTAYLVFITPEDSANDLAAPAVTAKTVNGFDVNIYIDNGGTALTFDPDQLAVLVIL